MTANDHHSLSRLQSGCPSYQQRLKITKVVNQSSFSLAVVKWFLFSLSVVVRLLSSKRSAGGSGQFFSSEVAVLDWPWEEVGVALTLLPLRVP